MNRFRYSHSIFLLPLALIFSGCSVTLSYKTKDIRKQIKKFDQSIKKMDQDVGADFREKTNIYKTLVKSGANPEVEPYPALKAQLRIMLNEKRNYENSKTLYSQDKNNLLLQIQRKKRVKIDDPEYKTVETWKASSERFKDTATPIARSYIKASNQFVKILNDNKIYKVSFTELKAKVERSMNHLTKSALRNRRLHEKNKGRLEDDPNRLKILEQADDSIDRIDAMVKKAGLVSKEFVQEVGKSKSGYVAPHMKSHTIMAELKQLVNMMTAEGNKTQSIYKEVEDQ